MICRGIRSNRTLEETLEEMGRRSELQEICEFAEVFAIAKRNSGNIPGRSRRRATSVAAD